MDLDQLEDLSLRQITALVQTAARRKTDLEHQHRKERERLDIELVHHLPHGFEKIALGGTVRPWVKAMLEGMADDIALAIEDHIAENKITIRRKSNMFNVGDLIELLMLNTMSHISYIDGRADADRPPLLIKYYDDANGDRKIHLNEEFLSNFIAYRSWTKSHHTHQCKEHDKVQDLVAAVPFRRDGGSYDE